MKSEDIISVLICVHSQDTQHDYMFREALSSLADQYYKNFYTVVVLDECWRHTAKVAYDFSDLLNIFIFKRPKKEGLAAAKNFGIDRCPGDWIAYLDADDLWLPCKLDVQREYMLNHPAVDFCFTNAYDLIDDKMVPNCFSILDYRTHEQIREALPQQNVLCHGSAVIRRMVLYSLDGYRNVLGREDWDLWLRAANAGWNFYKIPERLYISRLGTSVAR